jgi:hypothetical protein
MLLNFICMLGGLVGCIDLSVLLVLQDSITYLGWRSFGISDLSGSTTCKKLTDDCCILIYNLFKLKQRLDMFPERILLQGIIPMYFYIL